MVDAMTENGKTASNTALVFTQIQPAEQSKWATGMRVKEKDGSTKMKIRILGTIMVKTMVEIFQELIRKEVNNLFELIITDNEEKYLN